MLEEFGPSGASHIGVAAGLGAGDSVGGEADGEGMGHLSGGDVTSARWRPDSGLGRVAGGAVVGSRSGGAAPTALARWRSCEGVLARLAKRDSERPMALGLSVSARQTFLFGAAKPVELQERGAAAVRRPSSVSSSISRSRLISSRSRAARSNSRFVAASRIWFSMSLSTALRLAPTWICSLPDLSLPIETVTWSFS